MLVNKHTTKHGTIITLKPFKVKLCDGLKYDKIRNKKTRP